MTRTQTSTPRRPRAYPVQPSRGGILIAAAATLSAGVFPAPPAGVLPAFAPSALAAQEVAIEERVALDLEGRVLRVDDELARALGLFGDLAGVTEILLFRSGDGYILEVTRRRDGRMTRERRPLTESQVAALRAEISRRLALDVAATVDRSGRYLLLGTSTAAGLGFYGWAIPQALNIDDTKGQIALYMLVASASFFGPWLWSADRPVSMGMANAAFWGASRGIVHGVAVAELTGGDRTTLAMTGSLLEGVGALSWAKAVGADAGQAHTVGIASDFGALGMLALGATLGGSDWEDDAYWGLALGGAALGFGGGIAVDRARDYSWGDGEILRAAGLLGGLTGITIADLTGSEEEQLFAGLALGGGAAGVVLGDRLVRGRRTPAGHGLLVDLGSVAGGLLGLGVAVLLTDVDGDDATPHLSLATAGAWAGFLATFASLPARASPFREGGEGGGGGPGAGPEPGARGVPPFSLDLVPMPGHATRGGSPSLPPLALRIRYRF